MGSYNRDWIRGSIRNHSYWLIPKEVNMVSDWVIKVLLKVSCTSTDWILRRPKMLMHMLVKDYNLISDNHR